MTSLSKLCFACSFFVIKSWPDQFFNSVSKLDSVNISREIYENLRNTQALGLFSCRSLLGRSKIAQEHSLNRTGVINYNKYGKQEGVGFISCSEKFVDNFLFHVLVLDYFVTTN